MSDIEGRIASEAILPSESGQNCLFKYYQTLDVSCYLLCLVYEKKYCTRWLANCWVHHLANVDRVSRMDVLPMLVGCQSASLVYWYQGLQKPRLFRIFLL